MYSRRLEGGNAAEDTSDTEENVGFLPQRSRVSSILDFEKQCHSNPGRIIRVNNSKRRSSNSFKECFAASKNHLYIEIILMNV